MATNWGGRGSFPFRKTSVFVCRLMYFLWGKNGRRPKLGGSGYPETISCW